MIKPGSCEDFSEDGKAKGRDRMEVKKINEIKSCSQYLRPQRGRKMMSQVCDLNDCHHSVNKKETTDKRIKRGMKLMHYMVILRPSGNLPG